MYIPGNPQEPKRPITLMGSDGKAVYAEESKNYEQY
jgi:hypothetical protein